jgi:hypothetical protein
MSFYLGRLIAADRNLREGERLTFGVAAEVVNDLHDPLVIYTSYQTLIKSGGQSKSTVIRSWASLEKKGYVKQLPPEQARAILTERKWKAHPQSAVHVVNLSAFTDEVFKRAGVRRPDPGLPLGSMQVSDATAVKMLYKLGMLKPGEVPA